MSSDAYLFGPFLLDAAMRALKRDGADVPLGSRAFDILVALVQAHGQILTRKALMAAAWPGLVVEDSNIRVQVGNLRKILGCGKEGARYIASVAGRGYCFIATVQRVDNPGDTVSDISGPPHAAGKAPRASDLPISVPAPLDHAIGRDHNTLELTSLLQNHRLITVLGPGGSGKTTLAILAAHAQDTFGEAVYFIDLTSVRAGDHLLDAVAGTVGFRTSGSVTVNGLADYVKDRKALLILDNCEHLVEATGDFCTRFLDACANLTFMCTSREALRVMGERIYLMRPLEWPPDGMGITADQAIHWSAVKLFVERAEESGATNVLNDESAAIIGSICARLDGNPLAIELAASRVGYYGVQAISDLLLSGVVLHWRGRRDAVPRHKTVETMLDWTYELLGMDDRTALNRLSVFTGGFSMEAAVHVISDEKLPPVRAASAIADLADRSLVSASSDGDDTCLRLLDLTRTYAANKLASSGERDATAQRHARYLLEVLRTAARRAAGEDPGEILLRGDQLDDIRAAMDWCFSSNHDIDLGVQLGALLAPITMATTACLPNSFGAAPARSHKLAGHRKMA